MMECDFHGWATKANIKCSDGRTIMKNAFEHNDGRTVPLVWNHRHDSPYDVLGHAVLENRDDGVYTYCFFNDSENGQLSKVLVQHGDITALSIYANHLKQQGGNVMYGEIREVSLVHAGANPGATITSVIAHSDDGEPIESEDECIIHTGENFVLYHANDTDANPDTKDDNKDKKEDPVKDEKENKDENEDKTLQEIYDGMTEQEQTAVHAMMGMIIEKDHNNDDIEHNDDDNKGGNEIMKENVFDKGTVQNNNALSHSDQEVILKMAKSSTVGSLQAAIQKFADDNNLQHDAVSGGFVQEGEGNITNLFPEYKEVRPGAPELITNDQGWISVVMQKVHKSPISRIRTSQVDIRNIEALRAKGYKKGKEKTLTGNFKLVRRTTDPQTIFVKNAIHRDDIIDITDFDYVQYLYNIDRMMFNEELATAIMLGDGREDGDEYKIAEDKIRPIWTDDDLYTLHYDLDIEKAKEELQGSDTGVHFGENYIYAEAFINTVLYAREKYKGSGTPDLYLTPHMLNVMLLARDMNGRRIYSSKSELASALNVANIYTVEQFEGKTRKTEDGDTKKLLALIVNLSDYALGATKGGELTHFTQFDIDFNQEKSLLEGRCSGALTKVYSAIAIETPVDESAAG